MHLFGNNGAISPRLVDINAISDILIIEIELIGNLIWSISIIQQKGEITKCIQI